MINTFPKCWKAVDVKLNEQLKRRSYLILGEMKDGVLTIESVVDIITGKALDSEELNEDVKQTITEKWYSTVGEGDFLHPHTFALACSLAYPESNLIVDVQGARDAEIITTEQLHATIERSNS